MLDIELDAIEQRCDETGKLLEDTKRLITEVKRLREQSKVQNSDGWDCAVTVTTRDV